MEKSALIKKLLICGMAEFVILAIALFLSFNGITFRKQLIWLVPGIFLCGLISTGIILKHVLKRRNEQNKTSEYYEEKSLSK